MKRTNSKMPIADDGHNFVKALQEMEGARTYLENVLYSAPDAIVVINYDGKMKTVNHAVTDLLGYEKETLIGRDAAILLAGKGTAFFEQEALGRLMQEGSVTNLEVVFRSQEEKEVPMLLSGSVLRDDQGKLLGVVLIAKDVTELKKVDRMKDQFLSTVSHELRTPLTSMKGMVSNIAAGVTGEVQPRQREYLQRIDANIDRLTHIIGNLLDISKLQSGAVPLQRKSVDLSDLVRDVVGLFQGQAVEAAIALVVEGCDRSHPLLVDDERLRQVLNNLIGNALKFTESRGRVTVGLGEADSEVTISVDDTGRGIPKRDLPHIFDRFYQVSHEAGGEEKGVGLGLAIAKEIVEMHDGKMSVESEPGKGSRFTVHLPKGVP